jgi:hypothetical protein
MRRCFLNVFSRFWQSRNTISYPNIAASSADKFASRFAKFVYPSNNQSPTPYDLSIVTLCPDNWRALRSPGTVAVLEIEQ